MGERPDWHRLRGLFQAGDFHLHSGGRSRFKIDCDALSDDDLRVLAEIVASRFSFSAVTGIPAGGLRFAQHLKRLTPEPNRNADALKLPILLVDDVWTTGASMREARDKMEPRLPVVGIVIFARGEVERWVHPLFTTEWF